ncbi:GNAT family N-acetyltransferase [bacterium]|nr:GNAT family N-acetyltransferase [bacterium]
MKIEKIKKEDLEKIWILESLSFGMGEKAKSIFKKEIAQYEGYKIIIDNKLVSAVFFQKMLLNFGTVSYKTVGISYVATLPEYRGQKHVRKMFEYLIPKFEKEDYFFTSLYAFKIEYYKKFDYETVCQSLKYTFKPEIVPFFKDETLYKIEYLEDKHLKDYVNYFNNNLYKEFNGAYKKKVANEKIYNKWILDLEGYVRIYRIFLKDKENNTKGMFFYGIKRTADHHQKITVFEVFLDNDIAYKTFLNYLANFRDQADEIFINTNLGDRFEYLLNTLYFKKEIGTKQMLRILNFRKLISSLKIKNGSYNIAIKDKMIKKNTGNYFIKIENGKKIIKKSELKKSGMDIGLFVKLLFLDDALDFYGSKGFLKKNEIKFLHAFEERKISYVTEDF